MPPIDETFVNYLVSGRASTLKATTLPYKLLKLTSRLKGRAYAAVGQAVLQAYPADLLKEKGFLLDAAVLPSELFGISVKEGDLREMIQYKRKQCR